MESTAESQSQVQEQVPPAVPTSQDRAAADAWRIFKERVFRGIRWSGWQLDRKGDDVATLAIMYALEPGKPIGFNRKTSVSSVASPDDHLIKLRDAAVDFVEEFAAANAGAPAMEIITSRDDPIFDQSPLTQAGLLIVELSGGQPPGPEPIVEDEDEHAALGAIEAERAHNEVMVQEFGTPKPSRLDIVRAALKRRPQ